MTVWISELAENDLLNSWTYTLDRWDEAQADAYVEVFADRFALLATQPGAGRAIDGVRPGYRRAQLGSHLIFYRQVPGGIEIARILHEHMDPALHL